MSFILTNILSLYFSSIYHDHYRNVNALNSVWQSRMYKEMKYHETLWMHVLNHTFHHTDFNYPHTNLSNLTQLSIRILVRFDPTNLANIMISVKKQLSLFQWTWWSHFYHERLFLGKRITTVVNNHLTEENTECK